MNRNKKNNVYPCKPKFYYIKLEFKGVKIRSLLLFLVVVAVVVVLAVVVQVEVVVIVAVAVFVVVVVVFELAEAATVVVELYINSSRIQQK